MRWLAVALCALGSWSAAAHEAAPVSVEIVAPDALPAVAELNSNPTRFLTSKVFAASRTRREMVGLALIKLATSDIDNAAALARLSPRPARGLAGS